MDALMTLLLEKSPSAILVLSLLKATIVLTVAQLMVSAMPRLSAATKHLLLTAGLAAFLVIPLLAMFGPEWSVAVAKAAPDPAFTGPVYEEPMVMDPLVPAPPAETRGDSVSNESARSGEPGSTVSFGVTLIVVWLGVSLFLIARLMLSFLRIGRVVGEAVPASARLADLLDETRWIVGLDTPVRVLVSDKVSVPMVWGVRRGTLLLPSVAESWRVEDVRATLIHELGHLQRFDYLSLTLMNLISTLVWFHPQVWSARRRALAEGERACDDLVLRTGERPSRYASHLLHVARLMPRRDRLAPFLAMSRPSQLEGRMYAILSTAVNRQGIGRKSIMSSLALFTALVVPLSILHFTTLSAGAAPVDAPMPASAETYVSPAAEPIAVVAQRSAAAPSPEPRPRAERVRGTYTSTRGDTGTCSDYSFGFNDDEVARAEETMSFGGRQLHVTAADNGGIRLRRSTTGSFTITACKAAGGVNQAEAERVLSGISVHERGGAVTVDGPDDREWVVHLIVGVPDGLSITALGKNGPLSVDGLDATISAEVINGPLSVSNSHGEIELRAINGPLSINGMSGNVDASVVNGPLTLTLDDNDWVGGELRASVENGPLSVELPLTYGSGVMVKTRGNAPLSCSLPECAAAMADSAHPSSWRAQDILLGSGSTRVYVEGGNGPVAISTRK